MSHDPFDALQAFTMASGKAGQFYSLPALEQAGAGNISRLPVSIRIVLESVLRNCDGRKITTEHIKQLANWQPNAPRTHEIPFIVARILLQDFTGVPLLCDLAAMRGAASRLGKNRKLLKRLVPDELNVSHSGQGQSYKTPKARELNRTVEIQHKDERYTASKGGMKA